MISDYQVQQMAKRRKIDEATVRAELRRIHDELEIQYAGTASFEIHVNADTGNIRVDVKPLDHSAHGVEAMHLRTAALELEMVYGRARSALPLLCVKMGSDRVVGA